MRAMVMLAYVRLLYDVEREAGDQNLEGKERRALRQAKSLPILADIHAYLERERPKVLPKSPEGQAMAYTLSNWEALVRYGEDGDLEIDNNGAERSLRGVAVGRNYVHPQVMYSRPRCGRAGRGVEACRLHIIKETPGISKCDHRAGSGTV